MPEGGNGEGTGATPADATGATPGGNEGATPEPTGATPAESDDLGAKLEAARREAIAERKERQALAAKVKEYEDAKLTEAEKSSKRIAELEASNSTLEATLADLRSRDALVAAASKAGALYPDAVARMADRSKLEHDGDGAVKNADAVVAELLKSYPAMFGRNGSADGGPQGRTSGDGGIGGDAADMNRAIREKAGRG
jgi:hypothetical protein